MFNLFKKKRAVYQNIDVEEFNKLKDIEGYVILDVRARQEIREGFVPGYTQIDFFNSGFMAEIKKLDKSKSYLVYCRSGTRSARACVMMADVGFDNLYNLQWGIGTWNEFKESS